MEELRARRVMSELEEYHQLRGTDLLLQKVAIGYEDNNLFEWEVTVTELESYASKVLKFKLQFG